MKVFLLLLICSLGFAKESRNDQFQKLINHLVELEEPQEVRIQSLGLNYSVVVHNEKVRKLMKSNYSAEDLKTIEELLAKSSEIKINERGLVQAADRELKDNQDPTNYNAVWLRDSLWVYLALNEQGSSDAKRVLMGMLDYVSSPAQLKRFENIIANPKLVTSKTGNMDVVHIRFDGRSTDFQDVLVNGEPQQWNHKQNDALGLLFDLVLRAIEKGEIHSSELSESNWMALAYFPAYFAKIKYYQMEDAGPWEEIDRSNSSSIGLVTSGLESLQRLLYGGKGPKDFSKTLFARARNMKEIKGSRVSAFLSRNNLNSQIKYGYQRIFKQLAAGGESPLYKKTDLKYREPDAALLNLIYPAQLSRLKLSDKREIIRIIQPLIGRVGIKRYLNDPYQGGNYWFLDLAQPTPGLDERTADASSHEAFSDRASKFIPSTEAQWFFDSWLSKCFGLIYAQSKLESDRAQQIRFFNRALGQITARKALGADGSPVPEMAFTESYNSIAIKHSQFFVPSPITPLNWAKASYTLARIALLPR